MRALPLIREDCVPVPEAALAPPHSPASRAPPTVSFPQRRGEQWGAGNAAGPLLPAPTDPSGPSSAHLEVLVLGLPLACCVAQQMATPPTSLPQFPHLDKFGANAIFSKAQLSNLNAKGKCRRNAPLDPPSPARVAPTPDRISAELSWFLLQHPDPRSPSLCPRCRRLSASPPGPPCPRRCSPGPHSARRGHVTGDGVSRRSSLSKQRPLADTGVTKSRAPGLCGWSSL